MKITRLEIKDYKQFKDLTLNLTYPIGHKQAGEPLNKICIIGQSGTGKTNLLEIIRDKLYNDSVKTHFVEEENLTNEEIYFVSTNRKTISLDKDRDNNVIKEDEYAISKSDKNLLEQLDRARNTIVKDSLTQTKNRYLVLSHEQEKTILEKSIEIDKNIAEIKAKYTPIKRNNFQSLKTTYTNIDSSAWSLLEKKIANYDAERLKYTDIVSNKLLNLDDYTKDDFKNEIKEWEDKNENILEKISKKLNTILSKFNLELIKIDKNQKSYNDLTIKDLSNGNIIKYKSLSTGTKNLIATFIPLKIYNPQNSIILIDEPENSFYPDIQYKLTNLYIELGENNQLIMATHSPLIASSFEPWEVVELRFDENNQIYRERYYEGDNHIDNYTLDPRMLTWTGILIDIFEMKEDSNFRFREKKLMEYAMLKAKIKAMTDIKAKEEVFQQLQKIGKHLGLYN